jgi:hypothetical protein
MGILQDLLNPDEESLFKNSEALKNLPIIRTKPSGNDHLDIISGEIRIVRDISVDDLNGLADPFMEQILKSQDDDITNILSEFVSRYELLLKGIEKP